MWAPGRIPAGTSSDALVTTMDLLPSLASLAESELPGDRKIDGLDLSATITGEMEAKRKEFIYYSSNGQLDGIRQGDWKLLRREKKPMLFNLAEDVSESKNLADENPKIVAALTTRMKELDAEITENARPVWKKG